eukprot:645292-Ditylum_brightwellii.AAC.1
MIHSWINLQHPLSKSSGATATLLLCMALIPTSTTSTILEGVQIQGGTFMLNYNVDEIIFDGDGKANGVKYNNELARTKIIIGDPLYFPRDK